MANFRSLKDYLTFLYGEDAGNAWVGDVDTPIDEEFSNWWGRGLARHCDPDTLPAMNALYHSSGVLKNDAQGNGKKQEHFAHLSVLMLDDVSVDGSTPHDLSAVTGVLGKYRVAVRSSPSKLQVTYRIATPITDWLTARKVQLGAAALGLTDKGGQNPLRYQRLPGGVNGKPGPNMLFRVEAWDACEDDDVLDDEKIGLLVKAYEKAVVSGTLKAVNTTGVGTFSANIDAPDVWLRRLDALGMVKGPGRMRGVVDIVCPWEDEHTSAHGTPAGYLGGGRFQCFHRCACRSDTEFQQKIICDTAEVLGVSEDAVRDMWAREPFQGNEAGEDLAAEDDMAAQTPPVPLDRIDPGKGFVEWKRDVLPRVVYVRQQDRFLDTATGVAWTPKAFRAAVRGLVPMHEFGKNSGEMEFHKLGGRQVEKLTYAPGDPEFTRDIRTGMDVVNTWKPKTGFLPRGSVTDADVSRWLKHVALLIPHDEIRWCVLDLLSYILKHPEGKVNWMLVLIGPQGVGKDMMFLPLKWGLGAGNYSDVTVAELEGSFNAAWLPRKAVFVQELSLFGKKALYEMMKTIIAAPPNELPVNEKYMTTYLIPNRVVLIGTSNHIGAVTIPWDDRRTWPVIIPEDAKQPPEWYADLARWYEQDDGLRKVATWLRDRALTPNGLFDPKVCPPDMAGFKGTVAYEASADAAQWVADTLWEMKENGRTIVAGAEVMALWSRRPRGETGGRALSGHHLAEGLRLAGCRGLTDRIRVREVKDVRTKLFALPGARLPQTPRSPGGRVGPSPAAIDSYREAWAKEVDHGLFGDAPRGFGPDPEI